MDVNVPTKIVLPPISPLFATGERMFQPVQVHPLPHVAIPSLRTPTNNQAILSFNRAFAMSSPVQKEANKTNNLSMYKNVSALESFKLDRSFPSGFVSSTTDNEDFVSGNDGTVQDNGKKTRMNRERNRLHAQRTRSRKRELLENLKESISMLEHEYQLLKHVYESHVTAVCLLSLGGNWIQGLDEMINVVNDHGSVKDVKAVDSTFGVDEINSCLDDGSLIGDCTGTKSSVVCSKEEREQCRRERNRLHARRARLRKKLLLEKNQKEVTFLRARNENLRSRLRMLVAMIYEDQSSFVPIRMA